MVFHHQMDHGWNKVTEDVCPILHLCKDDAAIPGGTAVDNLGNVASDWWMVMRWPICLKK